MLANKLVPKFAALDWKRMAHQRQMIADEGIIALFLPTESLSEK